MGSIEEQFTVQLEKERNKLIKITFFKLVNDILVDYQIDWKEEIIDKLEELLARNFFDFDEVIEIITFFRNMRLEYESDMHIYDKFESDLITLLNTYKKFKLNAL